MFENEHLPTTILSLSLNFDLDTDGCTLKELATASGCNPCFLFAFVSECVQNRVQLV